MTAAERRVTAAERRVMAAGRRVMAAGRTQLGAVAVLLTGAVFVAVAGLPGLVAAALVGIGWVLSPTYAFALGHVALAAVGPESFFAFAAVEGGLLGVLLAPAMTLKKPAVPVAVAVGAVLVGGALAWASATDSAGSLVGLPTAAVLLVVAFALAAYVLNRYQLLTLGDGYERSPENVSKSGEGRE